LAQTAIRQNGKVFLMMFSYVLRLGAPLLWKLRKRSFVVPPLQEILKYRKFSPEGDTTKPFRFFTDNIFLKFIFLLTICGIAAYSVSAQNAATTEGAIKSPLNLQDMRLQKAFVTTDTANTYAAISSYFNLRQGSSSKELIHRALRANAELAATRLDIERGRARLRQASLRPNPAIDFEQTTGQFSGSKGERETSIGFSLPIESGGKRQRRIDLAQLEIAAAEASLAERERQLIREVRTAFAEALAAIRELQITESLATIDTQTARIIEARVTEGDSSPLELSLIRVETDRLKARRALVEGRLQIAFLKLRQLTGISPDEPLQVSETLLTPILPAPSLSIEAAIDMALKTRPDVRLARILEAAAQAGLRLAKAQATPDLTAFGKFTVNRSLFDDTPVGILRDKDKLLTFGISITLPLFHRNQGNKAEAEIAIQQAQHRREFVEAAVRSEVAAAYTRYEAARSSLAIFEKGVVERSGQNIRAISRAYELGAFSLTELLAEQRRLLDSEREFIESLTSRYLALAEIQSAIGTTFTQQ
jgi:outer membrane protein, heavy metal efflux system